MFQLGTLSVRADDIRSDAAIFDNRYNFYVRSVSHRRLVSAISVGHTDTKFYYQCGILTLIQQMAPQYCPTY